MSNAKTKRRLSISVIVDSDVADRLPSSISSKELIELLLKPQNNSDVLYNEIKTTDTTTVPLEEVNNIIENKFTHILNNVLSKLSLSGAHSNTTNTSSNDIVVNDGEGVEDFFASFTNANNISLPNEGDAQVEEEFVFDLENFEEG